ncbi:unnamed protein product [Gulo gulo]|uniref:Uncharacterized protein n=1 Tax=Gulo gulo TaxID=48420 RepID=A0A9X9LPJ8_GULGU|nr:unnamed protein product [Gulo gulo]
MAETSYSSATIYPEPRRMSTESSTASKCHKSDKAYRIQLSELVEICELTPVKLSKRLTCPAAGGMLSLICPIPRGKEPALRGTNGSCDNSASLEACPLQVLK